ncbi:hypothetical protein THAOC_33676 [Thalassiosira oceanica]|uniref:Uncharacterized protein n=1 Tax=Thalassiosira oceanica TaxID=159749 RepID=K0R3S1_THAOC|nr:hypothetical protein THAOC_33676 [Thalassiosira oceanica]|eukprot:EJK47593.1 hypothetical protein THAOC_33676 [Thalassiosira oceanica]
MLPVLVSLVTLAILVPPGEAFQGRAPRVPDVRPLSASSPRHRLPIEEEVSRQVAPPPAVSVPVWSLTCPVSIPAGGGASGGRGPSASMSILTYVTPVSVSSPKLWAISLFKTSFTRCCFLGVPNPGEEYNDSPAISSSVNYSPGSARSSVRRRAAMGEAGVLGDLEGSSGWRAKVRAGEGRYSIPGGTGQTPAGVGVLQLLSPGQSDLVPILGKATGWDGSVDKGEECSKLAHGWARVEGRGAEFEVLPDCASYLEVRLKRVTDGGDHDVALAEIIGVGAWDGAAKTVRWLDENEAGGQASIDPSTALYSGQLRTEGII